VRGTETRATQLAASLLSDLGGGATHLLAYEWQHEHVDRPYWGTPLRTPAVGRLGVDPGTRFQNYNSTDGLYAQRVQWLRSVTQWQATPTLQFTNTLYAYGALRDYRNGETYRFNAANTQVARSGVLLQRHDHQVVGERLEGRQQGTLLGRRSDWAFGLGVNVNRQTRFPNSLSGTVDTTDPYDPVVERFFDIPGMAPGFHADRTNKATTAAVYLENRTALVPTLHLVTALRHERISLDLTNRRAVTAALPAAFSRSYQPTTGRMGLVWDIVPGANLYAQYATAADPPSGVLSTASFADVINNSRLTSGRQAEVGGKLDFWDGKGTATLALYTITRSNIATQDPDRPGVTVLVGEQSARGAEIGVGLRPAPRWQGEAQPTHVGCAVRAVRAGRRVAGGQDPHEHPGDGGQPLAGVRAHAHAAGQRGRAPRGQGICRRRQHPTVAFLHAAGPGPGVEAEPHDHPHGPRAQCHRPRICGQRGQPGLPRRAAHAERSAARGFLKHGVRKPCRTSNAGCSSPTAGWVWRCACCSRCGSSPAW